MRRPGSGLAVGQQPTIARPRRAARNVASSLAVIGSVSGWGACPSRGNLHRPDQDRQKHQRRHHCRWAVRPPRRPRQLRPSRPQRSERHPSRRPQKPFRRNGCRRRHVSGLASRVRKLAAAFAGTSRRGGQLAGLARAITPLVRKKTFSVSDPAATSRLWFRHVLRRRSSAAPYAVKLYVVWSDGKPFGANVYGSWAEPGRLDGLPVLPERGAREKVKAQVSPGGLDGDYSACWNRRFATGPDRSERVPRKKLGGRCAGRLGWPLSSASNFGLSVTSGQAEHHVP